MSKGVFPTGTRKREIPWSMDTDAKASKYLNVGKQVGMDYLTGIGAFAPASDNRAFMQMIRNVADLNESVLHAESSTIRGNGPRVCLYKYKVRGNRFGQNYEHLIGQPVFSFKECRNDDTVMLLTLSQLNAMLAYGSLHLSTMQRGLTQKEKEDAQAVLETYEELIPLNEVSLLENWTYEGLIGGVEPTEGFGHVNHGEERLYLDYEVVVVKSGVTYGPWLWSNAQRGSSVGFATKWVVPESNKNYHLADGTAFSFEKSVCSSILQLVPAINEGCWEVAVDDCYIVPDEEVQVLHIEEETGAHAPTDLMSSHSQIHGRRLAIYRRPHPYFYSAGVVVEIGSYSKAPTGASVYYSLASGQNANSLGKVGIFVQSIERAT